MYVMCVVYHVACDVYHVHVSHECEHEHERAHCVVQESAKGECQRRVWQSECDKLWS